MSFVKGDGQELAVFGNLQFHGQVQRRLVRESDIGEMRDLVNVEGVHVQVHDVRVVAKRRDSFI